MPRPAKSKPNGVALGILIEEITGQPYTEVLPDRILTPLDLAET